MEGFLLVSLFVVLFYFVLAWGLGRHFLFVFMIWFGHFWMALSSAYLEGGVYITEQQRYSFSNNSTFYLLLLEACFWSCFILAVKFINVLFPSGRSVRYSLSMSWAVLLFSALALAMLLLNVVLTGSPLFNDSITRFNFWDNSRLPYLNMIFGNVASPIVVMVGVAYALSLDAGSKRAAKFSLCVFCGFLLYYILMGQKFGMLILAFSLFFPAILFLRWQKFGGLKLTIYQVVCVIVIALLLLGLVMWYYLEKHVDFIEGQGGVLNAVLYRAFGLQGHVWWGAVTEYQNGNLLSNPLGAMLDGMNAAMYAVSPSELVDRYLDSGVRFTMAYPGILLLSLGFFGAVLFQLIAGLVVGCLVILCERQLAEKRLLGSILALMLLSNFWVVLNMADFMSLFSIKFIMPLVAISLLFFVSAATRRVGY